MSIPGQRRFRTTTLLLALGAWGVVHWPARGPQDLTPWRVTAVPPLHATQALLLGHPLNLNCADATAFEILPGIGPALAARLVADRQHHGPFPTVETIERVRGIGPALHRRMQPFVTVGPCPDNP